MAADFQLGKAHSKVAKLLEMTNPSPDVLSLCRSGMLACGRLCGVCLYWNQWRAEGGGAGGAWPPGTSLGGGARPACRGEF